MDERKLYLVLDVLYKNKSSKILNRNGLTFRQIAEYTNYAFAEKLIKNSGKRIGLTEKGVASLAEWENNYKLRDKKLWIDKEESSKVDKIDKNFIYLPKRWEIDFE